MRSLQEVPSRGIRLTGETVTIQGCKLTNVRRAGLFVESQNFLMINNTFESLHTHAFSGNHNLFNFSLNTVNTLKDESFQISALIVDISKNTFNRIAGKYNPSYICPVLSVGSPFKSVLPTSVCVPESQDYGKNSRIYRFLPVFAPQNMKMRSLPSTEWCREQSCISRKMFSLSSSPRSSSSQVMRFM